MARARTAVVTGRMTGEAGAGRFPALAAPSRRPSMLGSPPEVSMEIAIRACET